MRIEIDNPDILLMELGYINGVLSAKDISINAPERDKLIANILKYKEVKENGNKG